MMNANQFILIAGALLLLCLQCHGVQVPQCIDKKCPHHQKCRHIKPCGLKATCDAIATCSDHRSWRPCRFGLPILIKENSTTKELICGPGYPCPSSTYCDASLADAGTVCCPSDPAMSVNKGTCPPKPAKILNPNYCVDHCNSDGDCGPSSKCCDTGCMRECLYIRTV